MPLTKDDIQKLEEFYIKAYARYPEDFARGVHWSSKASQHLRFEIFISHFKLKNKSILDIGCGNGEFLHFLENTDIKVNYTGIDLIEEYIDLAKKRVNDGYEIISKFNFLTGDFLKYDFVEKFDYAFACGIFNNTLENNIEYYQETVNKMLKISKRGVAFNMLKRNMHQHDDTHFTYLKEDVEGFVKSLNRKYKIVDNYLYYDFSVFIWN